jgi:hypothetical protein
MDIIMDIIFKTKKFGYGGLVMAEIKYDIIKTLGTLSEGAKGWKKEVNLVSWNNRTPKIDVREWDPEHIKMGKGITLTKEELLVFKSILEEMSQQDLDNLE